MKKGRFLSSVRLILRLLPISVALGLPVSAMATSKKTPDLIQQLKACSDALGGSQANRILVSDLFAMGLDDEHSTWAYIGLTREQGEALFSNGEIDLVDSVLEIVDHSGHAAAAKDAAIVADMFTMDRLIHIRLQRDFPDHKREFLQHYAEIMHDLNYAYSEDKKTSTKNVTIRQIADVFGKLDGLPDFTRNLKADHYPDYYGEVHRRKRRYLLDLLGMPEGDVKTIYDPGAKRLVDLFSAIPIKTGYVVAIRKLPANRLEFSKPLELSPGLVTSSSPSLHSILLLTDLVGIEPLGDHEFQFLSQLGKTDP